MGDVNSKGESMSGHVGGIDVIGDVHGHADKLEGLLRQLGYREQGGSWRHPDRTVMFIGDLIDRGTRQLDTVDIARRMIDAGQARIVMGNHEYNAIAFHTEHPDKPGDTLRTRMGKVGKKNLSQHSAFLDAVGDGSATHREIVEWFATIPLWIEDHGVRFIHACWDQSSMEVLEPVLGPGRTVTPEMMVSSSTKGHPHYVALETLIKGPEVDCEPFIDEDGHPRHRRRIEWWREDERGYTDEVPVFFGHYWSKEDDLFHSPRMLCVDLSAAKNGPLAAYRWDGEGTIDLDKLVTFK